jgi:signal recognition particle receptor subunit beta
MDQVKEELETTMNDLDLKESILCVLANKQDLDGCLSVAEISEQINFQNIPSKKKQIFGTSIKESDGFDQAFEWIVKSLNTNESNNQSTVQAQTSVSKTPQYLKLLSFLNFFAK